MKTVNKKAKGFSDEERAAMRERVKELNSENGEKAVLAKIDAMSEPDRSLAKRVHEIVTKAAPMLMSKLWYGMPAYAYKDGKIVCFFQDAKKFKSRYATLGFSDKANLDEGNMWPTGFALKKMTGVEESKIIALVKKAVG